MVVFNENWPRWITASIFKSFTDNATGLTVYPEGHERATNDLGSFVEIRLDGPHTKKITAENFCISVTINVLIQHAINKDLYSIDRMIGLVIKALPESLSVFKHGDDGTLLDCLRQTDKGHVVHRFGQVHEKTKKVLATVEVSYQLEL